MTFALTQALWGLLGLPAIVLLRILDRRPRVMLVPSLIPWRPAAAAAPAGRRRVVLDWPLALQLAAATAVVLAAAGPEVGGGSAGARPVVVVLDNSASMEARSADGTTRFSAARARAMLPVGKIPAGRIVAAVATAPEPRVFTRGDLGAPSGALAEIRTVPAAGDLPGAVAAARAAGGLGALLVVVADDLSALDGLPAGDLVAIRMGGPVRNLGLVAATVEDGRLFAAVRNASRAPEEARLTLASLASGKVIDVRESVIEPGGRAAFTFRLPAGLTGRVELRLPPDDLEADNVVRLSAEPPPRPFLLGRPSPALERALTALGFPEGTRAPDGRRPPAGAGLVVASGRWPESVPTGGFALVVAPPPGSLAGIEALDSQSPDRASPGESEPDFFPGIGDYSFAVPSARALRCGAGSRIILGTAERPLAVLSADGSVCVLAFDPETTDWIKHGSFPIFVARLAERVPALRRLRQSARPEGLLSEDETSCRVGGRERLAPASENAHLRPSARMNLAPWLFALALILLAAEWRLASGRKS